MLRNPMDVCVSYYYALGQNEGLEAFVEKFVKEETGSYGGWKAHTEDGKKAKNTLIVRYEDLIQDPQREVDRVAAFLSISPQDIGEKITFSAMSKQAKRLAPLNPTKFFRKGRVGSYKEELTEAQIEKLRAYGN